MFSELYVAFKYVTLYVSRPMPLKISQTAGLRTFITMLLLNCCQFITFAFSFLLLLVYIRDQIIFESPQTAKRPARI